MHKQIFFVKLAAECMKFCLHVFFSEETEPPPVTAPRNVTAFSAYALGSTSYAPDATLVFDNVVTNVGGGYNSTTGEFTCPVGGAYVFSLSIIHETEQLIADIQSEGVAYGTAYCFFSDAYDQGAVTVVMECDEGQVVSAINAGVSSGTLFGGSNRLGSMFTGYLLA